MGLFGWSHHDVPALCGKTALVTGANSGIGFELTRQLVEHGWKGMEAEGGEGGVGDVGAVGFAGGAAGVDDPRANRSHVHAKLHLTSQPQSVIMVGRDEQLVKWAARCGCAVVVEAAGLKGRACPFQFTVCCPCAQFL